MEPWRRREAERLLRCGIFDLDRVRFEPPDGGRSSSFYVIDAPDWINVIPLTASGDVLFIRQYRFGTDELTLEIPGGMCDRGEAPLVSAQRELREETGHEAREWVELGWVHPNPAIQNNRCFSYLARDVVRVGDPEPDAHESFEQVCVPLAEVPGRIAGGEITHSLVITAFHLLQAREASSASGC